MVLGKQQVPVLVDPACSSAKALHAAVVVDGRMTKRPPEPIGYVPSLYLGLGPGFIAGGNCQAVVETRRGPMLGRVYWQGGPDPDTGQPEGDPQRVLRAPAEGDLVAHAEIGQHLEAGQLIVEVAGQGITAPFAGVLRGLLHPGLRVTRGSEDRRHRPARRRAASARWSRIRPWRWAAGCWRRSYPGLKCAAHCGRKQTWQNIYHLL